ncbi:hypothetical protein MUK42_06283 [Musa troglodytarum]|uniref:Uncharacterized protein n=1 Tax=Musa troglodytarum TaxID=320322 RepID=A0A9E7KM67_9LILI|nr:hypothetical protein MUK42_06283 [Musa troglodytarum]
MRSWGRLHPHSPERSLLRSQHRESPLLSCRKQLLPEEGAGTGGLVISQALPPLPLRIQASHRHRSSSVRPQVAAVAALTLHLPGSSLTIFFSGERTESSISFTIVFSLLAVLPPVLLARVPHRQRAPQAPPSLRPMGVLGGSSSSSSSSVSCGRSTNPVPFFILIVP